MLKKFNKHIKNEKGLTLIELLAVIVILAIVAAIAVPAIGNIINNSKDKAILAEASNILSGAKLAEIDGVCVEATTAITCDISVLKDFVDGIPATIADGTTATNYSAELSTVAASKGWSITYNRIGDLKSSKYKGTTTTLTENALNTLLTK